MNNRGSNRQSLARPLRANGDADLAFQLIDGDSNFKSTTLNDFANEVNLYERGRSYAVVAIMGPQSSGKSTLLNHLFQTKFREMDESEGRSQTTQGIWLARCPNINPLTLVMDIEGTDGIERGEDGTTFERRSALFALAVADVVLVNLWCHDIGREHAASKPLLKVVFQQVLLRFSNKPRKITLMFVIRDKTKSPEYKLEARLRSDVEKIWDSIKRSTDSSSAPLSNFFKVEVVFLPHYELREEEFKSKVKELKRRFVDSTVPGGLADSGEEKEPASGFAISAESIWNDIKENKDLDIPAHKILVAIYRCSEICKELLDTFETDKDWGELRKKTLTDFIPDFGMRVNSILNHFLSKFDAAAFYYDEAITAGKRKELVDKLLEFVRPAYQDVLNHLMLQHSKKFMEVVDKSSDRKITFSLFDDHLSKFDEDCKAVKVDLANWDNLKERTKLRQGMEGYLHTKREDKIDQKIWHLERQVKQELLDFVGYLLCEEGDPSWWKVRKHLKSIMESSLSKLDDILSKCDIDENGRREKIQKIEQYAEEVVEAKAREECSRVEEHMINKFLTLFKIDHQWSSNKEIEAAVKDFLYAPLDILSGLAAVRLEAGNIDNIHQILSVAFQHPNRRNQKQLNSTTWRRVPLSRTLIKPVECAWFWKAYIMRANYAIKQAQENLKKRENSLDAICVALCGRDHLYSIESN
ncbi:hypothetical protein L6164_003026 [Bauhinia variegata]|uniref:Uncharacterized protein n=1 Tax=Bauhinia variegata TaxID=167791 RepID=A0ACB9Q1I7_BAUVA|nr:hypothetical protein L6164_003026 [Bauhinia variegata]